MSDQTDYHEDLAPVHMPPGGRTRAAQNAREQSAPVPVPQAPDISATLLPVPVRAGEVLPTTPWPSAHGSYFTVTIPASSAGIPSTRQLLGRDQLRQRAVIMPIDGAVIVATSLEEAQDPNNAGVDTPAGGYAAMPFEVFHQETVWAANPSVTAAVRVSVAVEQGGPA
jgi:hypothetical protein